MSLCMRILMLISICVLSLPVRAFDNGQYADVPNDIRSWFKGVLSPRGVPCCDIAEWTSHDLERRRSRSVLGADQR